MHDDVDLEEKKKKNFNNNDWPPILVQTRTLTGLSQDTHDQEEDQQPNKPSEGQ